MDFEREKLLKDALNNEEVIKVVNDNKIELEVLQNEVVNLYSFTLKDEKCRNCKGLENCNQEIIGLKPYLRFDGSFVCDFAPCKYKQVLIDEKIINDNLIALCCNLDKVDVADLFQKKNRQALLQKMAKIFNDHQNGVKTKGLYIHGSYGCGKSYVTACFARKYAENNNQVIFAYYPDLVRLIKANIGDSKNEVIIDNLKNTDVLFLDDFGGENITPFIRDEVLGAVLQYRMDNELLTFITSNVSPEILHNHLADTSRDVDDLKATRIEERIKVLMDFIQLDDINYRNN